MPPANPQNSVVQPNSDRSVNCWRMFAFYGARRSEFTRTLVAAMWRKGPSVTALELELPSVPTVRKCPLRRLQ
jgi:hypothetical protein